MNVIETGSQFIFGFSRLQSWRRKNAPLARFLRRFCFETKFRFGVIRAFEIFFPDQDAFAYFVGF